MAREPALKKELQREIEAEAEQILAGARSKEEALVGDARIEGQARLEAARDQLGRELARRRSRALSRARLEVRNALLNLRYGELDEAFAEARRKLKAMTASEPDRFGELLWSLFAVGRTLLPAGPLRVRLGEGGDRVVRRIREQEGVTLRQEKGWHGLIIESKDGRVRCDYSLDFLLGRCRDELLAEIEEILFEAERED